MDLARSAFRDMGPDRPRLTLMVSGDDQALAVSRLVGADSIRLGAIDRPSSRTSPSWSAQNIGVLNLST